MSVVTKTGDKGETGLLSGERVPKTDPRVEAYGTMDELVSFLGLSRSLKPFPEIAGPLQKIQKDLFRLGAELASTQLDPKWEVRIIGAEDVDVLESWVQTFEPTLNLPRSFVLPGGTQISATLDVARTMARRLERRMIGLVKDGIYKNLEAVRYVNRLSDLLFIFARYQQKKEKCEYEPV